MQIGAACLCNITAKQGAGFFRSSLLTAPVPEMFSRLNSYSAEKKNPVEIWAIIVHV